MLLFFFSIAIKLGVRIPFKRHFKSIILLSVAAVILLVFVGYLHTTPLYQGHGKMMNLLQLVVSGACFLTVFSLFAIANFGKAELLKIIKK